MNRLTSMLTIALLLAPAVAGAQQIDPHDPEAAVEQARKDCVEKHRGEDLGPLSVGALCELRGWATLGQHYPSLAERALEAEERANANASKINELRSQLRRERQQTDKLASKLGKQGAKLNRLEGRWPKWATWTLTGVGLVAGGAAGYGLAELLP